MVRSNQLPSGQLNLILGGAAIALAAIVTFGSSFAGGPIAHVFHAPGALMATLILWARPGLGEGWQRPFDLPTVCNLFIWSGVFLGILRHWVMRRRRG